MPNLNDILEQFLFDNPYVLETRNELDIEKRLSFSSSIQELNKAGVEEVYKQEPFRGNLPDSEKLSSNVDLFKAIIFLLIKASNDKLSSWLKFAYSWKQKDHIKRFTPYIQYLVNILSYIDSPVKEKPDPNMAKNLIAFLTQEKILRRHADALQTTLGGILSNEATNCEKVIESELSSKISVDESNPYLKNPDTHRLHSNSMASTSRELRTDSTSSALSLHTVNKSTVDLTSGNTSSALATTPIKKVPQALIDKINKKITELEARVKNEREFYLKWDGQKSLLDSTLIMIRKPIAERSNDTRPDTILKNISQFSICACFGHEPLDILLMKLNTMYRLLDETTHLNSNPSYQGKTESKTQNPEEAFAQSINMDPKKTYCSTSLLFKFLGRSGTKNLVKKVIKTAEQPKERTPGCFPIPWA